MHANLRPVSVIGTGMIKFGKHRDLTVPALAQPAVRDALREASTSSTVVSVRNCASGFSAPWRRAFTATSARSRSVAP